MDIVFAGTPDVAVPSLDALAASGHRIRAVLTRPDAPIGRRRVLTPSPVKARALELGLPVLEASRLRGDIIAQLRSLDVDAVAVVAYGAIAGPAALGTAALGWYNLHFSLLPAYRGAAPVQRALIDGRPSSGVSVFRIDEGMDTGPVLRRRELPLDHPDAAAALADYARLGAPELVAVFDDLEAGTAHPQPQTGTPSHAEKIGIDDARLDLRRPASVLVDLSRGVSPSPGPWAELDGKRTKLFGLAAAPGPDDTDVGLLTSWNGTAVLRCGDGWVSVAEIQPFGKSRMPAPDFLRGHGDVRFDVPAATAEPDPAEPADRDDPAPADANRGD
ncbi:methionyl-tRNA formyltransferase [Brevibacterium sanguinis]|uniref:Methionyl-tRNA formyltransferase n=2 Tax=Brevibacterium TaxID=1696 RepID=A0A366IIH2_9MICO|nr:MULTISPECIES: methionyl-tRNA formyltransferase [Brevibacterium]RBP61594.1 methionyl-tRNA formyltransferase [Brevibacterium sanguinis]RBP70846.1 methionyl-tRNA formyltransferase [Brevibacterium celere]